MNTHNEGEMPLQLVHEVNHPRRIWIIHSLMLFVVSYVMIKSVPGYEKTFKDLDAELPGVTLFLLNIDNWFLKCWFLVVAGWLLLMVTLHMCCRSGNSANAVVISRIIISAEVLWLAFVAFALSLLPDCVLEKLS